ncbi:hypothetical protein NP493_1888g00004 [Ridgeia piscesae]|uniref:Tetratricopeptide repeat protein 39B n=1 Tax=Ridgeia piscesae TaxID=27915 RepID=A0AAD9JQ26_RIDPI|nr:hypothetical protein NP493_1888g00004 [Ridgeia piscesae]
MDLNTAIEEAVVALNLFLNNKFSEARQRVEPWADRSMYHALCYGTIMYLQATMTFEARDIQMAVTVVKRSLQVCNRFRKKTSMIGSLTPGMKTNYNSYTAEEIHAELCYAECLIERAILSFIQDENLISFVKGSLKIRACQQSYKECVRILERRQWRDADNKVHFESGVRMGNGMFNLVRQDKTTLSNSGHNSDHNSGHTQ